MGAKPYPWYYAVNERPVKIVQLPDGSSDALVYQWATGAFTPDRSYFEKTMDHGPGKDVDQLTKDQFDGIVARLRAPVAAQRAATPIVWTHTGDGEFPYRADVEGRSFTIRVNDFPAEPLYTVMLDGHELEDMNDWPSAWVKP